ncbi:hypothetical protein V2J09_010813 [Rumex salicifolius]
MQVGDLNKVWETKALKKKPAQEEAKKMLERIANQVQPIMQKHKWRVKLLSEFCPKNECLLGLNVGAGVHVKLRLRRPNRDADFYPFDEVLDTMLHELCHNAHAPHNASFYKLWDELRKECEELMEKGITGTGQGFDLPGKRLGGRQQQPPPLSSLRETALAAAQRRRLSASGGPRRLGGDISIMSALSPVQAAAMAAQRRLQDEIWCASTFDFHPVVVIEDKEEEEEESSIDQAATSSSTCKSGLASTPPQVTNKRSVEDHVSTTKGKRVCQSIPTSHPLSPIMWDCKTCTLLNPPLAPVCSVCGAAKPKAASANYKSWSCKFCTLDNVVELNKCLACGHWRYSFGAPGEKPRTPFSLSEHIFWVQAGCCAHQKPGLNPV